MCSASEKASFSLGFFVTNRLRLYARAETNLAFKTTGLEDKYLTLAAIPFQVGVNISLIFFAVTNIRENDCRVSFPAESIIPC